MVLGFYYYWGRLKLGVKENRSESMEANSVVVCYLRYYYYL